MENRNLITFITTAELGSFSKAAHTLGYTQSTVSFQIKQLETELKCMLFDRIGHQIQLTNAGEALLSYALEAVHKEEDFKENFLHDDDIRGHVTLYAADSVCEAMMTANYHDFYAHYPNILLQFNTGSTSHLLGALDHNEADAVFTLDEHIYRNDYVIVKEEPVCLNFVVGLHSPLADCRSITLEELTRYPFLLTEQDMSYRRILDNELAKRSLEIIPVLETGRTDIIKSMVVDSQSVAFLPDFVTDELHEQGKLIYLNVEDFEPIIWKQLIHHKNKWLSRPLRVFLEYVKSHEFKK